MLDREENQNGRKKSSGPIEGYPWDEHLPELEIKLLQRESAKLRALAASGAVLKRGESPLFEDGVFAERLKLAREAELLIGATRGQRVPGEAKIIEMTGRVAAQAHGLAYDKADRSWKRAADAPASEADGAPHPSLTSLERMLRPQGGLVQNTFSTAYMTLIAHSFATPLEIWEAKDTAQFEIFIRREAMRRHGGAEGKRLIAFDDMDYLLEITEEATEDKDDFFATTDIHEAVARDHIVASERLNGSPSRSANRSKSATGADVSEKKKALQTNSAIWTIMSLPESFKQPNGVVAAQCLLFVREPKNGGTMLASRPNTHADGGVAHQGEFQHPTVLGPELTFGQTFEEMQFYLIAAKPTEDEAARLDKALCFTAWSDSHGGKAEAPDVTEAEFADLRRRVLRYPVGDIKILRRSFPITDE